MAKKAQESQHSAWPPRRRRTSEQGGTPTRAAGRHGHMGGSEAEDLSAFLRGLGLSCPPLIPLQASGWSRESLNGGLRLATRSSGEIVVGQSVTDHKVQ